MSVFKSRNSSTIKWKWICRHAATDCHIAVTTQVVATPPPRKLIEGDEFSPPPTRALKLCPGLKKTLQHFSSFAHSRDMFLIYIYIIWDRLFYTCTPHVCRWYTCNIKAQTKNIFQNYFKIFFDNYYLAGVYRLLNKIILMKSWMSLNFDKSVCFQFFCKMPKQGKASWAIMNLYS